MKQWKRLMALGLAGALALLSACDAETTEAEDSFQIYYIRADNQELDSALEGVAWEGDRDVDTLFAMLCAEPLEEVLDTGIPAGTSLQSWELTDGVLYLDVSGEYGTLTGVELTMTSYCIVLTMCQMEGVSGVSITADGEALMEETVLTPRQVMLNGGEGDTSTLVVTLYFPLSDGSGIGAEGRTLNISENRSEAESILDALCDGAESRELSGFLPDSAEGITLWIKEQICYVNLTEEWQLYLEEDWDTLAEKLLCIVNSLAQLDEVESVQFLMDGAAIDAWSEIGGDFPITPDMTSVAEAES
ncbi:MAG: GerMN domain-containing protein [Oscillospiraceae bacterium]|nr:GerMN domain-containing protein [Oscillospiraceae bacterium]